MPKLFDPFDPFAVLEYRLLQRLERIEHKLDRLINLEEQEVADLTHLTDAVTQSTEVEQSAITLLGELADLVRANSTDPAALETLADQLDANRDALAAAVTANTPAAPTP